VKTPSVGRWKGVGVTWLVRDMVHSHVDELQSGIPGSVENRGTVKLFCKVKEMQRV
jgi:hypothetical protein